MLDHILKQSLVENPVVGLEISDVEGRILETNPVYRDLLGYDSEEMAGLPVRKLFPDEDWDGECRQRQRLLSGDLAHHSLRKRYLTRSGKVIWCDTTMTVVRDADNRALKFVAMVVDATEQHRQELLQQGRAQVLELLYRDRPLEEISKAIVESIEAVENGLLCSILRLNGTTGRLHKLAAPSLPDFYNEAIEGMTIGDGVGSCGAAAYFGKRVIVADILNHPYWQRARRLVEKTDLRSCWSQPIFDTNGNVLGTFAIYYTEPREPGPFELELIDSAADLTALTINHKRAQATLQKSDQLKSEFIATAAHELNTPLASIVGYVDLLQHAQQSGAFSAEKTQSFMKVIGAKVDILTRIVNDLLDLRNIESGYRIAVEKKPTRVRSLLIRVVEQFRQDAPEHPLSLMIDDAVPEVLSVDEGRLVQVLENLIGNSVKYSPAGRPIVLVAAVEKGSLRLVLTDQGIGMSEEHLDRIFEKFYRADTSDTSIRGLGLGMSIVREIVVAHGGEIKVDSVAGKGTRVVVELPIS